MSKIVSIKAREILNSRGFPTVEVSVKTEKGYTGISSSNSASSIVNKEINELIDNDERYFGKGVLKAVNNVNNIISKELIGMDIFNQKEIDEKLISLNINKLGSNAILPISIACIKAASLESKKEIYEYLNPKEHKIPKCMFNIINGGKCFNNNIDIQEFMIVPKKETFKESLRCACEISQSLRTLINNENINISIGIDEEYSPNLKNNESALNYIIKAIEISGYKPGKDVFIALDIKANELYNKTNKTYKIDNNIYTNKELLDYYLSLLKKYPIISIEDPFSEEDAEGFKLISEKLSKGINIVGNDLFKTNKEELQKGINNHICNSIIIKPNQAGSFLQTLQIIALAKKNNYTCIISYENTDELDSFIIDMAVALSAPFIKCGKSISKYNRLLKIEEDILEKEK